MNWNVVKYVVGEVVSWAILLVFGLGTLFGIGYGFWRAAQNLKIILAVLVVFSGLIGVLSLLKIPVRWKEIHREDYMRWRRGIAQDVDDDDF